MMIFMLIIHSIICLLLMAIVLIQQGRGGGLVESFSGVELMFGPKTNAFLTRATTVLSIAFFVTCLSLALMSSRQSKSLMAGIKAPPAPVAAAPASAAPAPAAPAPASTPAPQTAK